MDFVRIIRPIGDLPAARDSHPDVDSEAAWIAIRLGVARRSARTHPDAAKVYLEAAERAALEYRTRTGK